MGWNLKSDRPIYAQLIEQIELMIVSGMYPPGAKLPSVRDLAADAAVNPNTMQRALSQLETDGLLYTQRTSGRYVTEDVDKIMQTKRARRGAGKSTLREGDALLRPCRPLSRCRRARTQSATALDAAEGRNAV
ncbi:MAG: GntR family transcriptional regulator [Anaeromassilibacillus sp.]